MKMSPAHFLAFSDKYEKCFNFPLPCNRENNDELKSCYLLLGREGYLLPPSVGGNKRCKPSCDFLI